MAGFNYYADLPEDLADLSFSIEDLWQPAKESLPPESGMYIITVEDLPFDQWPVQIGYFQSHDLVIGDGTVENALGEWYDMNGHEATVTACVPLPEPYREEGDG